MEQSEHELDPSGELFDWIMTSRVRYPSRSDVARVFVLRGISAVLMWRTDCLIGDVILWFTSR